MFRRGLCSVTFRELPVEQIVTLAAASGLDVVEWGGDVHVPPGSVRAARRVRDLGVEAGLGVASYGSYFRAGPHDADDFPPILDSARALGAPRIRIWAGTTGSARAGKAEREAVVRVTRAVADLAADHGIEVAFEFHGGTLADSPEATLALLDAVDRPGVSTYWQPPLRMPDDDALASLGAVLDRVCAVHVFSWWPGQERHRLDARATLWREVFALLARRPGALDALLEFVPDDAPDVLPREAASLTELMA